MTSAGPAERRPNDKSPQKRRLKWGCVTSRIDVAGDRGDGPTALPLPQHEPPQENAADQQRQQHEGDHADDVEHVLRHLVRGDLLPVPPLKLVVRLSGGGCGLPGLVPLPLQLGRSARQLRHALLQLPHRPLKLMFPGDGTAQQLLVGNVFRSPHPHEHAAALPADLHLSLPYHPSRSPSRPPPPTASP